MYTEMKSHEFWAGPDGQLCVDFTIFNINLGCSNPHPGDGVSFLATNAQVPGTLTDPNPTHSPFLFYNGKMGIDPMGIIFHRSWYWPEGRTNNPYGITDRWVDDDPYTQLAFLPWPPPAEYTNGPVTFYADWRASTPCYGSASSPFPDLMSALSFLPVKQTVSVAAGTYTVPYVLSRACTVVATGGTVTLVRSP